MQRDRKKRIRPTLLVLLWIWAVCVFLIVDLFFNVAEFDDIRPSARIYRAARCVAHRMSGEPYRDGDFDDQLPSLQRGAHAPLHTGELVDALTRVREFEQERDFAGLERRATRARDTRVRIAALSALTRLSGRSARDTLLAVAANAEEKEEVRVEAARLIGRTGEGSLQALNELLETLPDAVQRGAVMGLGERATPEAAESLLAIANGPTPRLRHAGHRALAAMSPCAGTVPVLCEALADDAVGLGTRVAVCRALAASGSGAAVEPLAAALEDPACPAELRAAAVNALGRMGHQVALPAVEAALQDDSRQVAHQARIAELRLRHGR